MRRLFAFCSAGGGVWWLGWIKAWDREEGDQTGGAVWRRWKCLHPLMCACVWMRVCLCWSVSLRPCVMVLSEKRIWWRGKCRERDEEAADVTCPCQTESVKVHVTDFVITEHWRLRRRDGPQTDGGRGKRWWCWWQRLSFWSQTLRYLEDQSLSTDN